MSVVRMPPSLSAGHKARPRTENRRDIMISFVSAAVALADKHLSNIAGIMTFRTALFGLACGAFALVGVAATAGSPIPTDLGRSLTLQPWLTEVDSLAVCADGTPAGDET